ncbi:glycosyltransferase family 4 protein [Bacillus sp. J37]|uniref:glycosyltransferase family 4 protein n=1 Tax=Bacillus sp. J37 TaxID=935837 RepID=UPI0004790657|nr:glycosyltransferase family 4 protein [Bacillus sp. J37]
MNKLGTKHVSTVLHLTTEFGDQLIGGLGRHVNDLVQSCKEENLTIIVMTISHTGKESYSFSDGIHIFRLIPWQEDSASLPDYFRNLNFRFTQFILQDLHIQFDLVHVHDWFFATTACQIKKMLGIPFVSTIHSTERERKQFNNGRVIPQIIEYEDQLLQYSDHIIVCSEYMKDILLIRKPNRQNSISVIPNGIILENLKKMLSKDEALKRFPFLTEPILLGIGRLVKEKGFHILIEAFSQIHRQYPTLKLVLAGSGPYENELKRISKLYKLDSKVIFVGFLNEIERNTLLSKCEIVVIPSLYEPFGIVALEGLAASKPVLAFKTGGLKEIVKDNRGILLEGISSVQLAERLHKCLQHPKDVEAVALRGYQAMIAEYQWLSIIRITISMYNKVVSNRNFFYK